MCVLCVDCVRSRDHEVEFAADVAVCSTAARLSHNNAAETAQTEETAQSDKTRRRQHETQHST